MSESEFKLIASDTVTKFSISAQASRMIRFFDPARGQIHSDELNCPFPEDVLTLVVSYLKYHEEKVPVEIKKPIESRNMIHICRDEHDAALVDGIKNCKTFLALVNAANWLSIPSLLDLCVAKLATLGIGRSPNRFRAILQGKADWPTMIGVDDEKQSTESVVLVD
jgi:hypothetical protein